MNFINLKILNKKSKKNTRIKAQDLFIELFFQNHNFYFYKNILIIPKN